MPLSPIEYKTVQIEYKADRKTRIIEGHASVFGNIDSYGDIVVAGAFADDIKENGQERPFFFNHDIWAPPIGHTTELREDETGLFFKGFLSETKRAEEILVLIADKTLKKSSFAFRTVEARYLEEDDEADRELLKMRLIEVSPVNFPANDEATVGMGKSAHYAEIRAVLERYDDEKRLADFAASVRALTESLRG